MSNEELEKIADRISGDYVQLRSDRIAHQIKLLRSIEIAALRQAREIAERNSSLGVYDNPALPELDKLILDLELK